MKATSQSDHGRQESTDSESLDLDERSERALTEYLTVLEDVGRARGAEDLYVVVSESGSEYLVDAREGKCSCPDSEYRDVFCKHARRVAFATGAEPIPAGVDGVDDSLGDHVSATPQVAAADGGTVVESDDSDESNAEQRRPDGCACWDSDSSLPCWPCFNAGFTAPNPEEPGASDGDADSEEVA